MIKKKKILIVLGRAGGRVCERIGGARRDERKLTFNQPEWNGTCLKLSELKRDGGIEGKEEISAIGLVKKKRRVGIIIFALLEMLLLEGGEQQGLRRAGVWRVCVIAVKKDGERRVGCWIWGNILWEGGREGGRREGGGGGDC